MAQKFNPWTGRFDIDSAMPIGSGVRNEVGSESPLMSKWEGRWLQAGANNADTNELGAPAITLQGARNAAVLDSSGIYVRYRAAASGGAAGWTTTGTSDWTTLYALPELVFVLKTGSSTDITQVHIWAGMQATNGTISAATPNNVVGFRFSTPNGDTTWRTYSSDGSSQEIKDSGITVTADTRYTLRLKAFSATLVKFYVNEKLVTTHNTTFPAPDTGLGVMVFQFNSSSPSAARDILIRSASMRSL